MSERNKSPFVKTPCNNCPFRTDKPFYLHPERAAEIAESLRRKEAFPCHKTVDYGAIEEMRGSLHCAGAMGILLKEGIPNQSMQIAHRWSAVNWSYEQAEEEMEGYPPLYESLDQFIEGKEILSSSESQAANKEPSVDE